MRFDWRNAPDFERNDQVRSNSTRSLTLFLLFSHRRTSPVCRRNSLNVEDQAESDRSERQSLGFR